MKYVYEGLAPEDNGEGGIVRPGDTADFDAPPDWGAWRPLLDDSAPVRVADQLAAGIPPEATVTMADQRAGTEVPPVPDPSPEA